MAPGHISFTWAVLTQQIIWAVFTFTALPEKYFQPLKLVLNNSLIVWHVQDSPLQDLQRSFGFLLAYIFSTTADSRPCNVVGGLVPCTDRFFEFGCFSISPSWRYSDHRRIVKQGMVLGSRSQITFLHSVGELLLLSKKLRAKLDNFRLFL